MKKHEPKRCIICGREYIPKRSDQRCCLAPECMKERQRLNRIEYRQREQTLRMVGKVRTEL